MMMIMIDKMMPCLNAEREGWLCDTPESTQDVSANGAEPPTADPPSAQGRPRRSIRPLVRFTN